MCGIAGILKKDGNPPDVGIIERMTNTMVHRGPDDQGIYIDSKIALGHRRLSIIDIEGGKQPMSDVSHRFHIVFNGEIYNYQELRRELETKGHTFYTRSDTEVLLHCCMEWGRRTPERLNGMFAFAFWDSKEQELLLVRDRLGIKPLYYAELDDCFIFASEIKALLEYPGLKITPNLDTVAFYLSHYQTVMGEETLYKEINTLEPAYTLTVIDGKAIKRKYWNLLLIPESEKEDLGEDFYIQKVRQLVDDSLRRRMISDVPLGAYLSGGIDSAILVALMVQYSNHPIKTFAIGFDEEGFNEFKYSDMVASAWGTDHTQIVMEEDDYFNAMQEVIAFKDAPLSVPNEVPLYLMSKILKDSITVVISGEGSDELFGGYGGILRSPIDYMRSLSCSNISDNQVKLHKKALMRLYGRTEFKDEMDHFLALYSWMKPEEVRMIFKTDVCSDRKDFISIKNYWMKQFSRIKDLDHYNKYLNLMETVHLTGLLGRLDSTTMAASVEGRVPFTDTELLEFITMIPFNYKLHWNSPMYESMCIRLNSYEIAETLDTTKYILKRSFVDKVPPDVLFRKKYSFPVPLNHWFGNGLLNRLIDAAELSLPDFLDKKGILEWLAISRDSDKPLKSWMLLNLIMWYEKYFCARELNIEELKFAAVIS